MKKKFLSIFLVFVIFIFYNLNNTEAINLTYDNEVSAIYVGDLDGSIALYQKDSDKSYPVASMSKMMTYLIIKEEIKQGKISLDDIVEITKESAKLNINGYSKFDLNIGEKVTVRRLLEALMIISGNDAANALAIHSSGNLESFVNKMNNKAKELGLSKSKFINPSGVTEGLEENQELKYNYMSAKDLYNLAKYIIKNFPETEEYGKQKVLNVPERNFTRESTLPLRELPSMIGLKTGSTPEAGYGFTGLFDMSKERNGEDYKLIIVVVGADTIDIRDITTKEIYSFVKDNYSLNKILDTKEPTVQIEDSTTSNKYISLYPKESINLLLPKGKTLDMEYVLDKEKQAPYKSGEILGEIILKQDSKEISRVKLLTKEDVSKLNLFKRLMNYIKNIFNKLIYLF